MGRIFVTGDKHGDFIAGHEDYAKIKTFCDTFETTLDDVMIILGDHGIHYDDRWGDHHARERLSKLPIRFVLLHGNHDMRPNKSWDLRWVKDFNGLCYIDPEASNIYYTVEFGWYRFGEKRVFVVCGAYSVDKYYRITMAAQGHKGYRWFADEQLSEEERSRAFDIFKEFVGKEEQVIVMSHTCPIRFKPTTGLISGIDNSTVDTTMEWFLDDIYDKFQSNISMWCCGHWHVDKVFGPMKFMYHDIMELS